MFAQLVLGEKQPEPKTWDLTTPTQAMRWAIEVAFKGAGRVSPNPMVGCVVLDKKNRFLSWGYHARLGEAHAEVMALEGLSAAELEGAKVFVTLEPCAHEGRTPSCAKMLAKLPVAEVIFGLVDPNPKVSGQGAQILKDAGKKVSTFVPQENQEFYFAGDPSWTPSRILEWTHRLEEVCEHFLFNQRQKKTFVSLKVASSLDGMMSLKNGESQWITSKDSRLRGHYLRAFHEAILVGAGTARMDDPQLNVRHQEFPHHQNKVVILDAAGDLLKEAPQMNLAKVHQPENLFFVVNEKIKSPRNPLGAQVVQGPVLSSGLLDLKQVTQALWAKGIHSVLVEGGSRVFSTCLQNCLWNRIYSFQAPILLGAAHGRSWTSELQVPRLEESLLLKRVRYHQIDQDLLTTGVSG